MLSGDKHSPDRHTQNIYHAFLYFSSTIFFNWQESNVLNALSDFYVDILFLLSEHFSVPFEKLHKNSTDVRPVHLRGDGSETPTLVQFGLSFDRCGSTARTWRTSLPANHHTGSSVHSSSFGTLRAMQTR